MQKPKEYLVSIGFLPPGSENKRGRISKEGIALCEKGASEGVLIEGYATSGTGSVAEPAPVSRVKVTTEKSVQELGPMFYAPETHRVFEWRDGKPVERSLTEACRNCRVSLVQCHCGSPLIVAHDGTGSVNVTIEPKERDTSS
jgi:hypothetical protein